MKLLVHTIRQLLQRIDEAEFNGEFPIYAAFQVVSLASVATQTPIPHHAEAMTAYAALQRAKRDGDYAKVKSLTITLQKLRQTTAPLTNAALEKYKDVNTEDNARPELWHKYSFGALDHEFE